MKNPSIVNRVLVALLIVNAAGVVYVAMRDNGSSSPKNELGEVLSVTQPPERSVAPTPSRTAIEIQRIGSGARAAANGDTLSVLMDGKPFTFVLGAAPQFSAWNDGIVGMKEGEQRKLTAQGGQTVIELVRIERPTPAPQ